MSSHWRIGETRTLSTTVKNNGILIDASTINFKYKIGLNGTETLITPTRASTGTYFVSITPTISGLLYCRWDTDGALDTVEEPIYHIAESAFT